MSRIPEIPGIPERPELNNKIVLHSEVVEKEIEGLRTQHAAIAAETTGPRKTAVHKAVATAPALPVIPPDPYNMDGTGYIDQLMALITAFSQDPGNMNKALAVIEYVIALSNAGKLTDKTPEGKTLLDLLKKADFPKMIDFLVNIVALQYFEGGGDQAALDFINQIEALIDPKHATDATKAILKELEILKAQFTSVNGAPSLFDLQHKNGDGYYWTISYNTSPPTFQTFYWPQDKDLILSLISYGDPDLPQPNSFWDNFDLGSLMGAYRSQVFDMAMKEFGGNPFFLILFILSSWDGQFQSQMGGYANQTNDLNDLTNDYITPLTNLWSKLGNWNDEDTTTFFHDLAAVTALIQMNPAMKAFQANFMSSTFSEFQSFFKDWEAVGNPPNPKQLKALTVEMNALNPPPSTGEPPAPNPLFQTLTNALQSGGSLITQQSKTVGTLASAMANSDDQALKTMAATVDPTGAGLVALILKIIGNSKTS